MSFHLNLQTGIPLPVSGRGEARSTGWADCDPDHNDTLAFLIIKLMSVCISSYFTYSTRKVAKNAD